MDLKFLSLFVSFKNRDTALDIIATLNSSGLLEDNEKTFISNYTALLGKIEGVPNRDLLVQQFPGYGFEYATELQDSVLMNNVAILLADKNNKKIAGKLVSIVARVNTQGVTDESKEELLEIINDNSLAESKEITDVMGNIESIYAEEKVQGGISTGVEEIDNNISGLSPGTISTIMGYTGSYKTLFAVNIAYVAITQGKNVCYLSLEVPKDHLAYNLLSRHSNNTKFNKRIGHFDIKKHKLSEEDRKYLFETVKKDFDTLPGGIALLDESDIPAYTKAGLDQLFRKVNESFIAKTGRGVELLIIDHAQLLKFNESGFNIKDPYQIVNYYVSFFRQQTLNFLNSGNKITTIVLSQASREGYKAAAKHQGKYDLTALAEANELERASSNVIALYTDEALKNSKQVKIQLLKARDGSTMAEPETIFADPEYYIIGNADITNPISIETFDTEDLFDVGSFSTGMSEVSLDD